MSSDGGWTIVGEKGRASKEKKFELKAKNKKIAQNEAKKYDLLSELASNANGNQV